MPTIDPRRVQAIFLLAIEAPDQASQDAVLDRECGADAALRHRVEELLGVHDDPSSFLDQPAAAPSPDDPSPPHADNAAARTEARETSAISAGATVAGRYRLLELIGEGGMGAVWKSEQREPVKRFVALKLIKPGMDSRQVLSRFATERQALALMDHPHIAKVFDGGVTEQGRPFFVMEYVKGIPITEFCDQARLSLRDRLELFLPVCQAVQHAHQKGVIHRDLKPSNILVCLYDGKPVPKVIDFGLAKAMHQPLTEQSVYTAHGYMVGTPLYMSPEQAEFNNLDVDTRTDVYSLGVILYELLTGSTPLEQQQFQQAALVEILRLIKDVEPPKPSTRTSGSASLPSVAAQRGLEPAQLGRQLRGDLDWIVMKSLEKERSRRYETANGLARDIQRYLGDEAVEACPPSASYRLRKFIRRNRAPVLSAALLIAAVVGGAVVSTWQAVRATRAESQARRSLAEVRVERDRVKTQRDRAVSAEKLAETRLAEVVEQRDRATKAEGQAKTEAAVSAAVNDFLQNSLLYQAAPENEPDRDITLRTVLDRAAATVGDQFPDQPRVEAAIRDTIGRTYLSLGLYDEAVKHLERSRELFEGVLGGKHEDAMFAYSGLASALSETGDFQRAEEMYLKAIDAAHAISADLSTENMLKNNLATLYLQRGQFDKAEPMLKEALDSRRRVQGADHPDTLGIMGNLAGVYAERGNSSEAVPILQEVYDIQRRTLGPDHLDTLHTMANLATAHFTVGEYKESEHLLTECLPVCRRILGNEHPQTLHVITQLALTYSHQFRADEAEALLSEALQIQRRTIGKDNPKTLSTMSVLVATLGLLGKFEKAVELAKENIDLSRQVYGETHKVTTEAMLLLAQQFQNQGLYDEAGQLLLQIIEKTRVSLGPEHWQTLLTMHTLANVYHLQRRNEAAEELLTQTLEAQQRVEGAGSFHVFLSKALLGKVHLAQGRLEQAEILFKETFDRLQTDFVENDAMLIDAANNLWQVYDKEGKRAEAHELCRRMIEIFKQQLTDVLELAHALAIQGKAYLGLRAFSDAELMLSECVAIRQRESPDDWLLFNSKSMLGEALLGQKNFDAAEPLLIEGYEGMTARESQIPPQGKDRLPTAAKRLALFYETRAAEGDAEKAEKWRQIQAPTGSPK